MDEMAQVKSDNLISTGPKSHRMRISRDAVRHDAPTHSRLHPRRNVPASRDKRRRALHGETAPQSRPDRTNVRSSPTVLSFSLTRG